MAWLESHGNLARHPKTRRLMQRMGWTLPATLGNLHLLWYWALDYAPTGDLTKFEPDQLTYDLDLGDATPEQFLDAMIDAGFIDRIGSGSAESRSGWTMVAAGFIDRDESGTLRLHDWPDYTAKSLRPKFRRDPEKWHDVLRSYNRPIFTRRTTRRVAGEASVRSSSPTLVKHEPQKPFSASPDSANSSTEQPAHQITPISSANEAVTTEQQMANTRRLKAEVPRSLSLQPGFVEVWWPRLLDMYNRKGTPLDSNQRHELLARLCVRSNSAIKLLKLCVEHSLDCRWEHLDNTA